MLFYKRLNSIVKFLQAVSFIPQTILRNLPPWSPSSHHSLQPGLGFSILCNPLPYFSHSIINFIYILVTPSIPISLALSKAQVECLLNK